MSGLQDRTRYDPAEVEPRIVARWLRAGIFHPEPAGDAAENYSIAIPLPNVTGVLHMGHALNDSIQDCLIRFHRMRGQRTKWILGTDHAGIATQTQVVRALAEVGTSREALGREAFIERVWRWREDYGGQIIEQLKRLGASCDYETERFTLDDAYARAVQHVFVALYEKGYIYRDRYMVNWDPGSRSAISDLEVEDEEVTDTLYYIDYPLASGSGAITVATVRPETMLADTAIAVHPEDDRYRRLVGETAVLPLVGRKLKIIADEYVKPEFGTGALKITPGHDPNDFEIGARHGLAQVSVIGEDGAITDEAPERFRGLTVEQARDAVVAELREQGLIARTDEYVHEVPFSQRSGERIEPLISLQWFMRMDDLAPPAIDVVRSDRVRFWPQSYTRVYLNWMENIRPWCISRQLWWGHRIPVWYRGEELHVGMSPPDGEGWERDPDVLDTWFSSGLFPFAALGWPQETPQLRAFYPTDALVTGREIVFLWVARMIMLGLEFTGEIPFTDVYVHSIIHAPDGRRMSKSLGTGVDPLALIEGGPRPSGFAEGGEFPPYGADAVRWGMLAMSSSQDVNFSEERIAQGQQLTNKLWNASRLILLGVGAQARAAAMPATVEDRWILSRLHRARTEVASRIERFDFSHAALALYDFVYGELCDWYLELVKPRLRAGEGELAATLLHVLTETLSLAHPIIPFVTEEIYSHVPGAEGLLAAGIDGAGADGAGSADAAVAVPAADEAAEASLGRVIEAVQALRAWRNAAGVKAGATMPARLAAQGYEDTGEHLARLARLHFSEDGGEPVTLVPVPGGAVEILASEHLDLEASERKRAARRAELEREIERSERKLANPGFVSKAPAAVVAAERAKLARLRAELEAS
ncbi:MAG: valine--tRNA ligase [Solirubrobacterales bacterium]|nr:valine--tRNA ligase [Solirubrobacterales bacterium]MBV9715171.1 valine--tRNA ligase [Solirubrobacterales bacterium]